MTDAATSNCLECGTTPKGKIVRGLCNACYLRWYRAQKQAGTFLPAKAKRPVGDRLQEKGRLMPNGCIHWTGFITEAGYGRIQVDGHGALAHRAAYEAFIGPVPEGMELDHICHNLDQECPGGKTCQHRRCINPQHLEPVTRRQNQERSRHTKTGRMECFRGHPFTPENTQTLSDGRRRCKTCEQMRRDALYSAPPDEEIRPYCRNGHALTEENTWVKGRMTQCRTCHNERMRAWRARRKTQ